MPRAHSRSVEWPGWLRLCPKADSERKKIQRLDRISNISESSESREPYRGNARLVIRNTYCGIPWERRPRYDWVLYQEVLEPEENYLQRSASEFIARNGSYITTRHDGRRCVCRNVSRSIAKELALLRNIKEMTGTFSRAEILVVVLDSSKPTSRRIN